MCGEEFFRARLASLWVETFLYALHAGLFAGSIYVLTYKRPHKYYLLTTIALFGLCSSFMILDLVKILETPGFTMNTYFSGYTSYSCSDGGDEHSANSEPVFTYVLLTIQDALSAVAQILAHGLLIYRCLIIWGRKRLIIVPSLVALVAMTVFNFVDLYYDAQIYRFRHVLLPSETRPMQLDEAERMNNILAEASFAFGLATNALTTVLIVMRIWWATRELERTLGRGAVTRYRSAMLMIIESGALYSLSLVMFLVVNACSPEYVAIPNNAMQQVMGIAPALIIVRVGMGKGVEPSQARPRATNINNLLSPAYGNHPPTSSADVEMTDDQYTTSAQVHTETKAEVDIMSAEHV